MKGRVARELERLKSLNLKIQEATSKNLVISEKNGKKFVRQIISANQRHFLTNVTPAIDFTDESVLQCDVPVVENTFVNIFANKL